MAIDADAILEEIATNVSQPASVQTDAGSVTMHNLFNQLEVARKLKGMQAQASRHIGFVPRKITFGSTRLE